MAYSYFSWPDRASNFRQARQQAVRPRPDALVRWLWLVAALVVTMVIVGGLTRLTESGLSITRWNLVSGVLPPFSHAQWERQFAFYKQTTEFQAVNQSMTLDDYRFIFLWEYIHRLLGRVIGLAFSLPLAWYTWTSAIPQGYTTRLVALLVLGGLQGAIGWWMVRSGLIGRVDVSHIRLAVHLLTALFILGGIVWTALDLHRLSVEGVDRPARITALAALALAVLVIQLCLGAFTAGLHAGHTFSSWPMMGDEWFPNEAPTLSPAWANLVDNPIVVQYAHRWWAWVAAILLLLLARRATRYGGGGIALVVYLLLAVQIGLGIATLLTGVNLWIAVAHQGVAALLVMTGVAAAHAVGAGPAPRRRIALMPPARS